MDADGTSLIEELRQAAPLLPPSHVPSAAELLGVVGALIAHAEFGERFYAAVKADLASVEQGEPATAVDQLWATEAAAPSAQTPAGQDASPKVELINALRAENEQMRQQLQTLVAQQGRTEATVEPSPPPEGTPS